MTKDNKPTDLQAKAMEYIRQGEEPSKAMIKAGYSPKTALHPKENLLQRGQVQNIIELYKVEYLKQGITPTYMVKKTAEWLEATKIKGSFTEPDRVVPDYQTQLKAAEFVRRDFGLMEESQINVNVNQVNVHPAFVEKYGNIQPTQRTTGSDAEQDKVEAR